MNPIPYIIQGKNIVIVTDNMPHTVTESHINYASLKAAIIAGDWDAVPNLVTPLKALKTYVKGHFECEGGVISECGVEIHNALSDRIFSMYEEGFSIEPMLLLYKNIKSNPSEESAAELYEFLENNSLPITSDGCFVAYKRVSKDYKDVYSGKFDNRVGNIVSMDRQGVDSNRNNECSNGLHFCSHSYLQHFHGARIMAVKINPADVVSIPRDYNYTKGRTCKYEVIGEVTDVAENDDTLSKTLVYHYEEDYEEDADTSYYNDYEIEDCINEMLELSLRSQALIWNKLTGGTLKKFSYRQDADRRIYESGQFTDVELVRAAKNLGLI